MTAFYEGNDFEDVVRCAVSLGGDCDTLTCIAAGIAEALYEIPENIEKECETLIPKDFLEVLEKFQQIRKEKADGRE